MRCLVLVSVSSAVEVVQKQCQNPRRACAARVTVLALCVCVSVCYRSSSYSVRFNLQPTALFWIEARGFSKKPSVQKLWREKANMQMSSNSQRAVFTQLRGPTKHSSYVKGNGWVECCFRDYYWRNRRETSEIQAKAYTGQRGTLRACAVDNAWCIQCLHMRVLHFN